MTKQEIGYAVLAALGVILPSYYNLQYMGTGGNLLVDFVTAPLRSAVTEERVRGAEGNFLATHTP